MIFYLKNVSGGWAVFDDYGKRYGMQRNLSNAIQLLNIRRHMALAGAAISSTDG
jgi:hypothetical protein